MTVDLSAQHFVGDLQRLSVGMRMADLFALAKSDAAECQRYLGMQARAAEARQR